MSDFQGFPTRRLSSRFLELDCLTTAGPRIVRLSFKGSDNLLAEVPDRRVPTAYGDYRFLGGHRLWHAPELSPRSYVPDGEGLTVSEVPDGVVLDGRREPVAGIRKRIRVSLDPDQPKVTVIHTLINEGLWDVKLAAWAITMFRLGGTALLPIRAKDSSANGLLPDRHFSLWPYSGVKDPRLHLEDEFVLIKARPNLPAFKIGALNPQGWIAYWLDGILFCKRFAVDGGASYPDYDCNSEIYTDGEMIELESLGPISTLAAGAQVQHTETWELYQGLEQEFLTDDMIQLVAAASG